MVDLVGIAKVLRLTDCLVKFCNYRLRCPEQKLRLVFQGKILIFGKWCVLWQSTTKRCAFGLRILFTLTTYDFHQLTVYQNYGYIFMLRLMLILYIANLCKFIPRVRPREWELSIYEQWSTGSYTNGTLNKDTVELHRCNNYGYYITSPPWLQYNP